MNETKISVIVLSFNRPRMLGEALRSIRHADEVIVVDDGSDFDIDKVVTDNPCPDSPPARVVKKSRMTTEKRLVTPRVGRNMNEAIRDARHEIIAYLCDDDLFAPDWLLNVKEHYDKGNEDHWLRGWWGVFKDGENPLALDDPMLHLRCNIMGRPPHGLTTGSFVHRKFCVQRCGVAWDEGSLAVHDSYLVGRLDRVHGAEQVHRLDVGAGWRREHPFNMLKHTTMDDKYTESGKRVLGGMLE